VRTRRLAQATVTAIGGGDVCLPLSASRGVPARDVEHALHEAISFGITLFDVAAHADSEKLAGDAVRAARARDRVVIATRVPLLDERPGAPRRDPLPERLPMPYVQDRIEAALRATRLDALPLAQLPLRPAWRASSAWPELVGTCARLVREGKVLAWGAWLDEPVATDEPRDATRGGVNGPASPGQRGRESPLLIDEDAVRALLAEPWLAAASVVYHLCDRRAAPVLAAAAAPRELCVLARQPLAGGALTGVLGPGVRLSPRDDRNELDARTLERIAIGVARLAAQVQREPPAVRSCEAARAAAERAAHTAPAHRECRDVAELALRFAIDRAGVALPRLHRRDHLIPAIAAAAARPLPADLAAEIERIFDGTG
jgi:aryl-alcohol dehydrogenase-like predicted oxidoreductase